MKELKPEDIARMRQISRSVSQHLMQFDNTEAAVAVAALMVCATKLLNLYPPKARDEIKDVMVMFLNGESPDQIVMPFNIGGPGGSRLIQ